MTPLSLGANPRQGDQLLQWCLQALRQIESASREDIAEIADSYSHTGTLTATRDVNITSPTAANLAAVLATFLQDMRQRGVNRVQAT